MSLIRKYFSVTDTQEGSWIHTDFAVSFFQTNSSSTDRIHITLDTIRLCQNETSRTEIQKENHVSALRLMRLIFLHMDQVNVCQKLAKEFVDADLNLRNVIKSEHVGTNDFLDTLTQSSKDPTFPYNSPGQDGKFEADTSDVVDEIIDKLNDDECNEEPQGVSNDGSDGNESSASDSENESEVTVEERITVTDPVSTTDNVSSTSQVQNKRHNSEKRYKCILCNDIVNSYDSFKIHMRSHVRLPECAKCGEDFLTVDEVAEHNKDCYNDNNEEKPYTCQICDASFRYKSGFLSHENLAHPSPTDSFECDACKRSFKTKFALIQHSIKTHRKKKDTECKVCRHKCPSFSSLNSHMLKHHNKEKRSSLKQCSTCDMKFGTIRFLQRHIAKEHRVKPCCQLCQKEFATVSKLAKHDCTAKETMKSTPDWKCKRCGQTFDRENKAAYLEHKRNVHPPEKKHFCEICGEGRASALGLKNHMMIHSGETPHKCDECDKSYRSKSALDKHKMTHGEKQFICQHCGQSFAKDTHLKTHILIHTGEKPYKCNICDKAFNQSGALGRHKKIHSGNRPIKCKFCGKGFIEKMDKDIHERGHTGEKPFKCDNCDMAFISRRALKNHSLSVHRGSLV